jgi:hypothetical protein
MKDALLRRELAHLLQGGHAHLTLEAALKGLEPRFRHVRPKRGRPTVWELLEHLRLAQQDILQYCLDPGWVSPEWPSGYWPAATRSLSDSAWRKTRSGFLADLKKLVELVNDPRIDLTAVIPHTKEHTYLREALLAADHNAYHLGQIVQTRKELGSWK